ncbi:MAG: L,D-transpeptidase family protein [Clostridia bacterium]|nr:L,D-transpeptidase family protein [Clostridia bacterium]
MKRFFACLITLSLLLSAIPAFATLTVSISNVSVRTGEEVSVWYNLPADGPVALSLLDEAGQTAAVLFEEQQTAGFHEYIWDGSAQGQYYPSGSYDLELRQGDDSIRLKLLLDTPDEFLIAASASNTETEPATESDPTETPPETAEQTPFNPTPALRSTHAAIHEPGTCYWCTPMDITDDETVWKMLTSPIYTLNENQKKQVIIRMEPNEKSPGVGVVTGTSMGVHVLENRPDGWSLIECHSASFFDSKVKAWNEFVTGYVKTSLIQKKTPSTQYGIVVDKLTQTLYLFHEGHLMTTLAVSTGQYNPKQPYNETRTGEFLLVSKVGDFRSDAMICSDAIRYNGGDLIHEVPHVKNADGSKSYKNTEYKIGNRGSHGCIRVQRLRNADGINMAWLWDHLVVDSKNGTRMVIWEDYQGRQMAIPSDDTLLYYNPNGGSYYHSTDSCPGVRSQYLPLTAFTYGELETGIFAKLERCPNCHPERRKAEIEAINQVHLTSSPGMVADYH